MNLNRRQFLLSSTVAGVGRAAAPPARPNIIFVLIDDLRYNALGCTGHPFVRTPNIDRIAAEGVNFRNSYVTTSLCSPSRASFLTGRYVHSHGIKDNGDNSALSHQLLTWPRLLRDAGYETGYVGKWHMGTDATPRPGFDRWVSFPGQGQYVDPRMNIDGKDTQARGYITDLLNEQAIDFIDRKREKPFALYLAHKAVHGPFTPAERHQNLYMNQRVAREPSVKDTLVGKPALERTLAAVNKQEPARKAGMAAGPASNDELVKNQLRCMKSVDEGIGLIFQMLQKNDQLDNTLILFTSDNGYLWGEHGLGDKRASYEESIRIPMIARYPALIQPGTKLDYFALNVDVAPTMVELAGLKPPKDVRGRSLLPLLKGDSRGWRRSFLAEYFEEPQYPRIPSYQCLRGERWKYTHYVDLPDADELYDVKADPYEMDNLARNSTAQDVVRDMKRELERQLKETS